jgi:hypothetical protein
MNRLTLSLLIFAAVFSVAFAGYNEAIAKELAHASYGSYCENDKLSTFKCGQNCDFLVGYQTLDHKKYSLSYKHEISYSTFINHKEKRLVVAFRGTSNVVQLFSEFYHSGAINCEFCKTDGAQVTKYFMSYYDSIFKSEFIAAMKAHAKAYPDYYYYITGHSLGGAFATLASLHLSVEGIFPKERLYLYTFGSPRVGNRIFARAVTANVKNAYRIVHDRDLVPHVPPCLTRDKKTCIQLEDIHEYDRKHDDELYFGWHLSPEVLYNSDFTSYRICDKEEDPTCANGIPGLSLSVKDHKSYLGARRECKIPLFSWGNLRLPSWSDIKERFKDDDDLTNEEEKQAIGNIFE